MAEDGSRRRYTDEEARAVLDRALAGERDARIGHEELIAAAQEVGLSREAVEQAIAEMEVTWAEHEAKRAVLARRRRRLKNHLVPFLAVNAFLFLINWLTTPGFLWFLFPMLPWALGLFFHAWAALSSEVSVSALRRELKRPERQQRLALQDLLERERRARERERQKRLGQNARILGEAVEEGVTGLLGRLAEELGRGERPRRGPRVDQKETGRVRVGHEQEPDEYQDDSEAARRRREGR